MDNNLETYIKYEIISLISDNIDVYLSNDNYFKRIKKYLRKNCDKDFSIPLSYELVLEFTKEVMLDLLMSKHSYDYINRDLLY